MAAMAYVLVLAIVALEVPLALSMRQRLETEVRQQAKNSAAVVAVLARGALEQDDEGSLQTIVDASEKGTRGRIVVVDQDGYLIADSSGSADLGGGMGRRPEIAKALAGHEVQVTRESQTLGRELLATAAPIVDNGRVKGAVRITQSVADVSDAFKRTVTGLVLIGLAVLAIGLVAGAIIARQITRPLKRFEQAARSVADGDLDARAPVEGSREQQDLARTFNEMTDRLSGSLSAQSRFVADASHQLRTPLTGLRLRLEEATALSDDPAVDEQLGHGIRETDRLARTVEELLLLSQTGERDARTESIDLAALVREAGERWNPLAASSDHVLNVDAAAASELEVEASRGDLGRVLDALLENAIVYSPAGSPVELVLDADRISVRDHGPGIGDEDGEELFTRFYRGSAGTGQTGGTGLGLAIARELARRWGADVTLENAPGGGALATITFSSAESETRS
jgi:signal transduction histidine kinase